jgi:hypothetical protein
MEHFISRWCGVVNVKLPEDRRRRTDVRGLQRPGKALSRFNTFYDDIILQLIFYIKINKLSMQSIAECYFSHIVI